MGDRTTRLRRRQFLGGVASLGAVAASGVAIGGTVAAFSDTEGSASTSILSGTLELTFGSPSSLDLTKDLTPGDSVASSVELRNVETIPGSLDVDVSYVDSGGGATADAVARELEVTALTYGGTSILGQLANTNGNGIVDLMDFATNDQTLGEITQNDVVDLPDPGAGTTFYIELTLQNGTNNLDGNSIDVQFTFHLNQIDAL